MQATDLQPLLRQIYPADVAEQVADRLIEVADRHRRADRRRKGRLRPLDETDVWLIAYPDHVTDDDSVPRPPLQVLTEVLEGPLGELGAGVHILPFHSSSSDDGFAVIDPRSVAAELGSWDDVARIGRGRRLVVDVVVNHVSASSRHVREWTSHVLEPMADFDTSNVVRPRTTPLLTPFERPDGGVSYAWTTFGPDQVDVDFSNPDVLVETTEILLAHLDRAASVIRLDAVGFLWKRSGTACLNLPETHAIVKVWRRLVDWCAPGALLVTETNVPHADNLAYLGDGGDEAHLVYQFALPPLVLASLVWGNVQDLARWAAALATPPGSASVINFLASHDGIGLRAVEGLLSPGQVEGLCVLARATGGGVSYRSTTDGRQLPYELNTTFTDALTQLADDGLGVPRILAAHAILLALQGVPAIWLGSLLGVGNWPEGAAQTGRLRTVHRRRLTLEEVRRATEDPATFAGAVLAGLRELIALRTASPAFAPDSPQRIIPGPPWLLAIERGEGSHRHLVLVSVSDRDRAVAPASVSAGSWVDQLGGQPSRPNGPGDQLVLPPYGVAWLRAA